MFLGTAPGCDLLGEVELSSNRQNLLCFRSGLSLIRACLVPALKGGSQAQQPPGPAQLSALGLLALLSWSCRLQRLRRKVAVRSLFPWPVVKLGPWWPAKLQGLLSRLLTKPLQRPAASQTPTPPAWWAGQAGGNLIGAGKGLEGNMFYI